SLPPVGSGTMHINVEPGFSPMGQPGLRAALAFTSPVPGGPARYSPNGTAWRLAVTGPGGVGLRELPAPATVTVQYNNADLAMAGNDPKLLTVGEEIDAGTPADQNPLGLPVGTWRIVPQEDVSVNPTGRTITVKTAGVGGQMAVMADPAGYARALSPLTEYSGFGPGAKPFGSRPAGTVLRVMAPQMGSRFLVLDPATNNYAYVDAASVGMVGPPKGDALLLMSVPDGAFPPVAMPKPGQVGIGDASGFGPQNIVVRNGDTVTWTNSGSQVHTVVADDGSFDSGGIAPGASWSHTFGQAGTYPYHSSTEPQYWYDKANGDLAVTYQFTGQVIAR
ncbi:MAG: cupredoxin domain-containing protein, partial [Chloroflexota bacterium]